MLLDLYPTFGGPAPSQSLILGSTEHHDTRHVARSYTRKARASTSSSLTAHATRTVGGRDEIELALILGAP